MNQPSQSQPPQGQSGPPPPLLKPEQMRNISYLTPQEKQKYEHGLRQLWARMDQNAPDTDEHQEAKTKVEEFSRMVMHKIRSLQARGLSAAPGQPGQQGQPGQPGGQPPSMPGGQPQAGPAAAPKPMMAANRPQVPTPGHNAGGASPAVSNAPATARPMQQGPTPQIIEHVNKMPWSLALVPPNIPPEQGPKWLNEHKQKFVRALASMEAYKHRMARLGVMFKERSEKGPPMSAEEKQKFQNQSAADQKMYKEAELFVNRTRSQIQVLQGASQTAGGQGQHHGAAQPSQAQPQPQNSGASASSHPMQAATASVSAAINAAKSQQLAAGNRPVSTGQQQPPPQTPATPATPSTTAPGQHQPHPAPAPQPQVKIEPGTHNMQHPPPPVNTALAAASSANMPSAGTPTQASARVQTPQSATQQAPGSQVREVRPLSHAAAVNRANSSTNVTGQPSASASGVTTTPGSGGLMGNASSSSQPGHTHAHPQPNTSTLTQKMPIPKSLPEKSTAIPTPVTVGGGNTPGRPTYGGGNAAGGVINQPVIAKMPVPQFDAEGDHVLSKKKLDELVRQVCGGASPGADANYLTPDVEESVLNVADNFVDNVMHTACRLAKERGSKVLEIRDIQLVLERVYNIRIPGYTTDELRTVRKVQPSNNWIAKMSAIQAAKVTSAGTAGATAGGGTVGDDGVSGADAAANAGAKRAELVQDKMDVDHK
ncbi:Uu.00g140060.m01.CDS01 [Anthostomella pinea]|uniref:Uu.00g140060.m01.CDS01 n=1 Tax=Anthostomella pinea TaxID=933095 RepID=A0AAI8VJK6_9PEZI|nr:Uu.00g140060.m01.CDS01 [Anthostomella pinea]